MAASTVVKTLPVELTDGLRRIGLGRAYFHSTLSGVNNQGAELSNWLSSGTGIVAIRDGVGVSIWSGLETSTLARDLFHVLARAVYLCGIRTRIISPTLLLAHIQERSPAPYIEAAEALFLPDFYRKSYRNSPFQESEQCAIEDYLFEKMANRVAIFTLSDSPIADAGGWWTPELLSFLTGNNRTIKVEIGH